MSETYATAPIGGIEAGGTRFTCVIARTPDAIVERTTIPTTTPGQTLDAVIRFFRDGARRHGRLAALGLASFGPIELDSTAPHYGFITQTPKPDWSDVPILSWLGEALGVPVAFDTDVNGAALGELHGGAAEGLSDFVYVTIGTGIGAGLFTGGRLLNGVSHPELGHLLVARHPDDDYAGCCPFHGGCLEGLASGPALERRWGLEPSAMPESHHGWAIEAHYLASLCHSLTCLTAPERIILGGGVMLQTHLFAKIRRQFIELSGGYFPWITAEKLERYIVPPAHLGRSGEVGALVLAEQCVSRLTP